MVHSLFFQHSARLNEQAAVNGLVSADEETALRKAIEARCPEQMPEFDRALNTGLRLSEQYVALGNVSLSRCTLTIPRSKNGTMRHVPLNQAVVRAPEKLRKSIRPQNSFAEVQESLGVGLSSS
jgi:hypothetical protein